MRTIHLRQSESGAWFVNVTSNYGALKSQSTYPTLPQAERAFVLEGRHQPCARMLIHIRGVSKAFVIRGPKPLGDKETAGVVDLHAIEAAFR